MTTREKDGVSWNVRKVSSPWNSSETGLNSVSLFLFHFIGSSNPLESHLIPANFEGAAQIFELKRVVDASKNHPFAVLGKAKQLCTCNIKRL